MEFKKENIVFAQADNFNSFGLDLTNPDLIGYEYENIEFELLGGLTDSTLNQMKVSLKIQKVFNKNAIQVYRTQMIDLFNENQLEYVISQVSDKIKVDTVKLKDAFYSLAQNLEDYRKYKLYTPNETISIKSSTKVLKETKDFLSKGDLTQKMSELFEKSGMPDGIMALKLFILNLSRITENPIHTIIQGNILLSNEICKLFSDLIPPDQIKIATSLSKHALSYPPIPNFWDKKLLLLHQLEGALNQKDSSIEEYILNQHLNKYVTEVNIQNGKYLTGSKTVNDSFSILGYTSKDFHKVFNASNVVCLPLKNTKVIKDKLNEFELKKYAGILNEAEINESIQLLHNIQRVLEPIKIINPFIEQIDFQLFFDNDVKKIKQFMQLTNLFTMLNRFQLNAKKYKGQLCYEVEPKHILTVLELFKELWVSNYDELYFQVNCTLNELKKCIKVDNPDDFEDAIFTEKEIQSKLKIHPSTLNRHFKKLTLHNKLKRVFGNNRSGFHYSITNWKENDESKDKFKTFKEQIENLRSPFESHSKKSA